MWSFESMSCPNPARDPIVRDRLRPRRRVIREGGDFDRSPRRIRPLTDTFHLHATDINDQHDNAPKLAVRKRVLVFIDCLSLYSGGHKWFILYCLDRIGRTF